MFLLLHFVTLKVLSLLFCNFIVFEINLALDSICFTLGGWRLLLISFTSAMAFFIFGLASRSEIVFYIYVYIAEFEDILYMSSNSVMCND